MIKKFSSSEIIGKKVPDQEIENFFNESNNYSLSPGQSETGDDIHDPNEKSFLNSSNDLDNEILINEDNVIYATNNDSIIKKISKNKNITIISKTNLDLENVINEDIRYSKILNATNDVMLNCFYSNAEDYKSFLSNFAKNSKPLARCIIKDSNKIVNNISNYCDFSDLESRIYRNEDNKSTVIIMKNNLDKVAYVDVGSKKGSFICDIAEDIREKTKGLQGRDFLDKDSGMIFPYKKAQDLLFHMGTVKFPIDIIFINANNSISKIYHNIKPNSLGTYGCPNVKSVLEIKGGYCKQNNIKEGEVVSFVRLSEMNKKELNELFNEKPTCLSKTSKLSKYDFDIPESILALSIDDIFNSENTIFSISNNNFKFSELNNFYIPEIKYGDLKIKKFASTKISKDDLDYPFVDKIVIYGNINETLVNKVALSRYFDLVSDKNIDFDIINTKDMDKGHVLSAIENKYGSDKIFILNGPIYKTANFPVSEDVKNTARSIDLKLKLVLKIIDKIEEDLDTNVSAYDKVKDKPDVVKGSKAQYYESTKNISKKFNQLLEGIEESIKLLNSIKDASQVIEIINSLATNSKISSDAITQIFNLVKKTDDINFFNELSSKSDEYKNLSKDIRFSIKRCREFIHSNILGVLILS